MTDDGKHLTPLDQDVLIVGGAAEADSDRLRRHLASCVVCRDEASARAARADRHRSQDLPAALERLRTAAGARRRMFQRRLVFAAMPAAAAAALCLVWPAQRTPPGTLGSKAGLAGGDVAIKGPPAIRLFVRRGDHVFMAPDGSWLSRGDALRFAIGPSGYPYLLIASVDGAGKVNVYHPFGGGASAPVDPMRPSELPSGSVVLDDAPGPERVFALFSREPLPSAAVGARLREIGAQGSDAIRKQTTLGIAGTIETSVLLEKLTERGRGE